MLPKSAFALTAAVILADKVVAFNARRIDASPERGAVYGNTKVEVVTDWVTITVTEDPPAITHLASSTSTSAYPTPPTTLLPKPKPSPAGVAHAEEVDNDANVGKPSQSAPGPPTPAPAPPAAAPVAPSPVRVEAPVLTTPIVTPQVASPSPLPAPPPPPPPPPSPSPAPPPSPSSVEVASVAAATQSPAGTMSTASTPSMGKRGLAYNDPDLLGLFGGSDKCTWAYNWDSTPGLLTRNIEFVPMLWGTNSDHTTAWTANAEAAIASGSTCVLSFNEPDNAGQANLSPAAAAAAHAQWVNPLAGKARIGSPAITNSQIPGQGTDWLQSFMDECKTQNCAIDFCVTHWYDFTTAADALFDHLEKVHTICDGKPVWLTEFAPIQADDSAIADFLVDVLGRLDALDYMERYSYFDVAVGSLLASPVALSKYGSVYSSH